MKCPGSGSSTSANGSRNSPPAHSCHAVSTSGETGGRQCRVSTVPTAIDTAPAAAAATPTASSRAAGPNTSSATPSSPPTPASQAAGRGRAPSQAHASTTTISGWIAPTVAATPPGSRYAAINSMAWKKPILSTPSTAARHHQLPRGSCRPKASIASPAGSARITPESNGCPGGSHWLVTR
ncbi:hypothetical protein D9M72_414130 [compost metagenome]